MDKVAAITVNWLTARRTLGAINSLRKYYPDMPLYVVDDGSNEKDKGIFNGVYSMHDEHGDLIYRPDIIYDPDTRKLLNLPKAEFIQVPTHRRHGEALDFILPRLNEKWMLHLDSDTRLIKDGVIEYMMGGVTDENCSVGRERLQHGAYNPDYPQISGSIFMFRNDLYRKYNLKMEPIYKSLLGPMTAYHHFLTHNGFKIKYLPSEFRQYYVHLRWSGQQGKDEWNKYF